MIEPFTSVFLSPTKKYRYLSVLLAIQDSSNTSQHRIGKQTNLSSSMVNNYIKAFKKEGLINVFGETNRSQSYHLTGKGREKLMQSLLAYSSEIIQLYIAVKHDVAGILNNMYEEGIRTLALFGVAETAEVVHAAIKEIPLVVIGVVDNDPTKQGKPFNGLIIQPPEMLKELRPDAVLITSFARQEEIYANIRSDIGKKMNIRTLSDIQTH